MKRFLLSLALCFTLAGATIAANQVEGAKSCQQCGMDREVFAQSRMLIVYADGTRAGECSLNCAVVEMKENRGKKVTTLMVADYGTKKLIVARTATWVVGGKKSGVMTSLPKWAFAGKVAAEKFMKENGGRITNFDEALNLAVKENE